MHGGLYCFPHKTKILLSILGYLTRPDMKAQTDQLLVDKEGLTPFLLQMIAEIDRKELMQDRGLIVSVL